MDEGVIDQLFEAAAKVRAAAYAPYSQFRVGAAILCEDGRLFAGCNVENAAFPSGTCAEESAIAAMVSAGARQISTLVVLGDAPTPVTPCGACRQRILEFATPATLVWCASTSGPGVARTMEELLPHAFGPDRLSRGQS